ncbi:MAG: hypothetical protein AB7O44_26465 [Hyphomicrobiaceae bacterium]
MTLTAPRLDDLTWEDLRLLAQRRVPAASGGQWTHHAAVDPGITLLELFAFLLEQQVFVLDQVPDALLHAVLRLLGEVTRPTIAARTVLSARPASGAVGSQRLLRGTVVRPVDPGLAELSFSLVTGCGVLPVAGIRIEMNGQDRTPASPDRPTALMSADGRAATFDILLRLGSPVPGNNPGPLSFLLDLDGPERVLPAWAPEATAAPSPVELRFSTVIDSAVEPLPATAVEDGTRGLRRSGLLRIAWQPRWSGRDEIRLRIATARASFAEPPRLRSLAANAVVARHAVRRVLEGRADAWGVTTADEEAAAVAMVARQIADWLPLSGLSLNLPDWLGAPLERGIALWLTGRDGTQRWRVAPETGTAGPADLRFTLDRLRGRLSFGDGYAGRVPAPATVFRLLYRVGGGEEGNLPAGREWEVVSMPAGSAAALPEITLSNPVPAAGGRPAERLEEARNRVAGSLSRSERVVNAADIRDLVQDMPGLGPHRAHVAPGFDPAFPCLTTPDAITVFVVPQAGRKDEDALAANPTPRPDPGAMTLFRERLERARLIGTRISVLPPQYRAVALRLTVRTDLLSTAPAARVLQVALARFLDPVVGGPEENGWPFGHMLRPSELVRRAQSAAGDELFVERVAIGLDNAEPEEDCGEVPIGPNDLVHLARFAVRFQPGAPVGSAPL